MTGTSNNIITQRRHDLDNLRTALTGLVTVHHTAIAYGGLGSWMFYSAGFERASSPILVGMNVFNQSFFMGLFFWISGRVSAQSLSRTPPSAFMKSKAIRLGIPALVYSYIIHPATRAVLHGSLASAQPIGHGLRGPVWYIGTLIAFDGAAALAKRLGVLSTDRKYASVQSKTYETLCRYGWLGVGLSSFLLRLWYPIGVTIPFLNLQPAFVSQYIYAYCLGLMSYQEKEDSMHSLLDPVLDHARIEKASSRSNNLNEKTQSSGLIKAVAVSLATMSLCILPAYVSDRKSWMQAAVDYLPGGLNLTAFAFAIWNEFSFMIMAPALLTYFRQRHSLSTSSSVITPRSSYTAFLIHAPVTVLIQSLADRVLFPGGRLRSWMHTSLWRILGPVLMTMIAGLASNYASFYLGGKVLSWVPGARRIV
ncbi:acyltransferase 3 [Xylariaceae sp. FL1019]|nr:acyltransferase 3 [Xylariaceae sp. FL1019]